jgi:hypothetical protein
LLANLNRSRILDIIPFREFLLANAIALRDAVKRISLTNGIGIGRPNSRWLAIIPDDSGVGFLSGPVNHRRKMWSRLATGKQQAGNEKQMTY